MGKSVWILAFALLLAPQQAPAADLQDRPEPAEIVVEGKRYNSKEVDDFVDALTRIRMSDEVGRFELQVCPASFGLLPQQNEAVVRRLRSVADAAGAKIAKPDCTPNILVVASWNPKALIEAWQRANPAFFVDATGTPIRLLGGDGPAISWHVEARRTADGEEANVATDPASGSKYYVVSSTIASRITPLTRPHFAAGVLILDMETLRGLTTTQLADYAAMRLLARTNVDRLHKSNAPSILSVLEAAPDAQVPITLTEWDFSFLKSLYQTPPHLRGYQKRGEMKRKMREELQSTP